VVETLGAPPPSGRRRRRPRRAEPGTEAAPLPLTRVTAVRAATPFSGAEEAGRWLEQATEAEDTADVLVGDGIALLNRALHLHAVASGDPHGHELAPERAVAVRLGYGGGDEVAAGRFGDAREIDVWASGASRRRRREEDLRPQERVAAALGGREELDACESLLLRARADLDAGREREAALQLRVGLEALLAELARALAAPRSARRPTRRCEASSPQNRWRPSANCSSSASGCCGADASSAARLNLYLRVRVRGGGRSPRRAGTRRDGGPHRGRRPRSRERRSR
jgi:hypothetical protein